MKEITLTINGADHTVELPEDMPLLWALRDKLDLVGTKFACGIGLCGSCTVLVNGKAVTSCLVIAATIDSEMRFSVISRMKPPSILR